MRPTFLILAKCVPPLGFESGVPLAACPPRAVRSQRSTHSSMGPRPPGFQPMSQSLHTAQGTMVVAWPPASPAPSRCPGTPPRELTAPPDSGAPVHASDTHSSRRDRAPALPRLRSAGPRVAPMTSEPLCPRVLKAPIQTHPFLDGIGFHVRL